MNIIQFPGTKTAAKKPPFEEVYEEFYTKVLRYCINHMHSREDAEDLTADAMVYCYEHYENFDPEKSSVSTWVFLVASSRLKNYYRDHHMDADLAELEEVLPAEETDMERAVFLTQMRAQLAQALELLPEKQRRAVVLRYFHNSSYEEIADECDTTPGNARVIISRALTKLSELSPQLQELLS